MWLFRKIPETYFTTRLWSARSVPVSALKIGLQGQGRVLGLRKRKHMHARYIPVSACFAGCSGQECESNEMHGKDTRSLWWCYSDAAGP